MNDASGFRRQASAMAALALMALGCGDGPAAPVQLVGIWQLISIDGDALPADITDVGTPTRFVIAGGFAFEEGNTYHEAYTLEEHDVAARDTTDLFFSGEWERDGDEVHLFFGEAEVTLELDDDRLINRETTWGEMIYVRAEDE